MSEETILPIRDGVLPAFDVEREMIDYCQLRLRRFIEGAGQPPTRIAIALMGKGENGKFHTAVYSWDSRDESTRIETCSVAAALFTQRAIGDE